MCNLQVKNIKTGFSQHFQIIIQHEYSVQILLIGQKIRLHEISPQCFMLLLFTPVKMHFISFHLKVKEFSCFQKKTSRQIIRNIFNFCLHLLFITARSKPKNLVNDQKLHTKREGIKNPTAIVCKHLYKAFKYIAVFVLA